MKKPRNTGFEKGRTAPPSGIRSQNLIHFIIPLYNKETTVVKNVTSVQNFIQSKLRDEYEILLCDDGSTDRTYECARELAAHMPHIRIVGYSKNKGRGYAIKFAAKTCTGNRAIYFDLDLPRTTPLEKILEMVRTLENHPVVIGSRFHPLSCTKRKPVRGLVGRIYLLFTKWFFPKLKLTDPDMGFKGFHRSVLQQINKISRMDGWSWDLEFLVAARQNNIPIEEIPIDWNEQHEEYSSSVHIFKDGWEELRGMTRIRRNMKKGLYVLYRDLTT
ncbi:MAG: glycosyltransferase [Candidatus Aminicenantes bacterium]|nr:glycosyltransferase [Candidatus Aminicenantes bacterium]